MVYSLIAVRDQEAGVPLPVSLRSLMLDGTHLHEHELAVWKIRKRPAALQ